MPVPRGKALRLLLLVACFAAIALSVANARFSDDLREDSADLAAEPMSSRKSYKHGKRL
jgi:hypothetical protein